MSVTQSKLHEGTLTLESLATGATASTKFEAACQATGVTIKAGTDSKDEGSIDVLCGDVATGTSSATPKDSLVIDAIQDWSAAVASSFSAFTWAHRGEEVKWTWVPFKGGPTWSGKAKIELPFDIGGEVNKRLTASVTWPITELTPPPGFGPGYGHAVVAITGLTAPTGGGKEWTLVPTGATKPADLAALKAHAVIGDAGTGKPGAAFGTGEFLTLADGTKANWSGTLWVAGAHA